MSKQVFIIVDYVYGLKPEDDKQPKILRVYNNKKEAELYVERRYKADINRNLKEHLTRILEIKKFQVR